MSIPEPSPLKRAQWLLCAVDRYNGDEAELRILLKRYDISPEELGITPEELERVLSGKKNVLGSRKCGCQSG